MNTVTKNCDDKTNKETVKKAVALFGSPHRGGVTSALLDAFMDKLDQSFTIERFDTYKINIKPCIDCKSCFKQYGCALDDNQSLFRSIEEADLLIVATPVYLMSFPAPLKAVFDRFQQYYGARFGLLKSPAIEKPKQAVFLLASGSETEEGSDIILKQAERAFSVMNTKIAGTVLLKGTDKLTDEKVKAAKEQARQTAIKIHECR